MTIPRHGLSNHLLTSDPMDEVGSRSRVRVDVAQTSFFEGREFRSFLELNIAQGATQVIKVVSPVDFVLFQQTLTVDSGGIRFSAVTGGTEGGSFSTSLPIIGKNRMSDRPTPYYTAQITASTGGTHTGGTEVEVVRVVAAGSTAQQATVGGEMASERGLPAGTYYLKFQNLSNGAATGVYSLFWEER